MSPAEAGAVIYEEPDWRDVFETECARKPNYPRYLQEADAFESTLKQWRRFHATLMADGKKMPANAVDGVIALACLGIMAPRSTWRDLPRDGRTGYQSDDHCWLSISGEQWRITGIEDRTLHLEKMTFDAKEPERKQIDLNRADWTKNTEAALAVLAAWRTHESDSRTSADSEGQAAGGGAAGGSQAGDSGA